MVVFDEFIVWLDYYGVADVILPFLLVFTIVYAVLQKSKILGDDSKRFNVAIALVMGFAVVIPHILGFYGRPSVVDIMNQALPQVSLIVVAIVMFLLMVGIFGKEIDFAGATLTGWAVLFSLIAVFLIFGSAAEWFYMPSFLYFLNDPGIQSLVVIILVFGLIIWFVTSEPKDKEERKFTKTIKDLGDFLK